MGNRLFLIHAGKAEVAVSGRDSPGCLAAPGPGELFGEIALLQPEGRRTATLQSAGLPDIRFHDLWCTCATLLPSRGVHAKLVQEFLGHSTIAVALDTYGHMLPGTNDRLADTMDEALGCRVAVRLQ